MKHDELCFDEMAASLKGTRMRPLLSCDRWQNAIELSRGLSWLR